MIKIIKDTNSLKENLKLETDIGFVPTMGNLHQGHLSLLSESLKNHKLSVLSIFVNPTQFGKHEDFDSYPRTLEDDISRVNALGAKNIIIYAPSSVSEVYGDCSNIYSIDKSTSLLEGEVRQGHFDGVTTVIYHLFNIIKPKAAYFGRKDFQQLYVVKELVKKYKFNTQIVGMPIVREKDGLAMSSRNNYLSSAQKRQALKLNKTLNQVVETHKKYRSIDRTNTYISSALADKSFNYLSLRDADTFERATANSKKLIILGNYQIGNTKLLDNIEFD